MKKNVIFLYSKFPKSPSEVFLIFVLPFYLNCTDEKILIENALQKEKLGKKTEALYDYSQILKKNSNSPLANKNTGMLLSESPLSIGVAIFHLEKAKKYLVEDRTLNLKLFDLYLIVDEQNRAVEILDELREVLDLETISFLENLILCHKGNIRLKEFPVKLKAPATTEFNWLEMNSLLRCKEKIGMGSENKK